MFISEMLHTTLWRDTVSNVAACDSSGKTRRYLRSSPANAQHLSTMAISELHKSPLGKHKYSNATSNLEKGSFAEPTTQSGPLSLSTAKGDLVILGIWSDAVGGTAQGSLQPRDNFIGNIQATLDSANEEIPFTMVARKNPKSKKKTMDKQDLSLNDGLISVDSQRHRR